MNTFIKMILASPMLNSAPCRMALQKKHHPFACRGTVKGKRVCRLLYNSAGMYGPAAELKRLTGYYVLQSSNIFITMSLWQLPEVSQAKPHCTKCYS